MDQETNQEKKQEPTSNDSPDKEDLSKKLRQKLKTQRLQRQSSDSQRTFLEKAKVPENMMDKAMSMLKQKTPNAALLQNMMSQLGALQSTTGQDSKMKAPNLDMESVLDDMKNSPLDMKSAMQALKHIKSNKSGKMKAPTVDID